MCGNILSDDAQFCPSCGEKVASATTEATPNSKPNQEKEQKNDFSSQFENIMDTPDTTEKYDTKDIEENKVLALLSYLSILFLIPYFAAPNSRFARYHVNQGAILFICSTVLSIVFGGLAAIPFAGIVFGICNGLVGIANLVLIIIGICNACSGRAKELPFIGKYTLIK